MSAAPKCPRCGGAIPNEQSAGAYPGAVSRTDDDTELCETCGVRESSEWQAGELVPQAEWLAPPASPINAPGGEA